MASFEVKLDRLSATYSAGEEVTGHLLVTGTTTFAVATVVVQGVLWAKPSPTAAGIVDALAGVCEHTFFQVKLEIAKDGKCEGTTKLPFKFKLEHGRETFPTDASDFAGQLGMLETFHGKYIHVRYGIEATLGRGWFTKDLSAGRMMNVKIPGQGWSPDIEKEIAAGALAVPFTLQPDALRKSKGSTVQAAVPPALKSADFVITGQLDAHTMKMGEVLTGWYCVERCGACVPSVDLQIARLEYCPSADGTQTLEVTEIQSLQIAVGDDVPRNSKIPISAMFPRWFCAPCMSLSDGRPLLGYEANLVFTLHDPAIDDTHEVVQSFPIRLYRPPETADAG